MLNLQKEYLKLQQKLCEEKLKKILTLKSHQISLEAAKHNEFVWELQSKFDTLINDIRLELRAINLARTFLQRRVRSSVECKTKKQTKLENTRLLYTMIHLLYGPQYIDSLCQKSKVRQWLNLQENELLVK